MAKLKPGAAMERTGAAVYVDMRTKATYPLMPPRWRSDTGGPLMLSPLEGLDRSEIDLGERSLWRYRAALPLTVENPVSLGVGCTPLAERRWRGAPDLTSSSNVAHRPAASRIAARA